MFSLRSWLQGEVVNANRRAGHMNRSLAQYLRKNCILYLAVIFAGSLLTSHPFLVLTLGVIWIAWQSDPDFCK